MQVGTHTFSDSGLLLALPHSHSLFVQTWHSFQVPSYCSNTHTPTGLLTRMIIMIHFLQSRTSISLYPLVGWVVVHVMTVRCGTTSQRSAKSTGYRLGFHYLGWNKKIKLGQGAFCWLTSTLSFISLSQCRFIQPKKINNCNPGLHWASFANRK